MRKNLLVLSLACLASLFSMAQNAPKREFRGAWVATYTNIDWPNRTQTPAQQRAAFITIANHHKATGLNALFIQIRSQCDAMYPSTIEPWSADLTGTQGVAPNPYWDPLQFMIDECHKRGMEFHAWFNPYRAVGNANNLGNFAAGHVAKQHPEWLLSQGTLRILDPGLPPVRDYVTGVIVDVLKRYDVDGIHFDDYFYPSPPGSGVTPFNDSASYAADPRGFTVRADWRRDNINLLIKRVYDSVKSIKPWVKFGVSPSGIYRNSTNPNIGSATSGLEHYTSLYADTRRWLQEGWIDYLCPQVYWYIGQPGANYGVVVPWWNNHAYNRHIYIGMAGYKVNDPASGANWANPSMIPNEIRLNRSYSNVYGQAIYNTNSLRSSTKLGFRDSLRFDFYRKPALLPNMPWRDSAAPAAPTALTAVKYGNDSVVLNWTKPLAADELDKVHQFVIYRSENPVIDIMNAENICTITNTDTTAFTDTTGIPHTIYYYTVTSTDRFHNESSTANMVSTLPPVVECMADTFIVLNNACSAVLPDYSHLAVVQASSPVTVTQVPAAGHIINGQQDTLVYIIATDAGGNADTCSFRVKTIDREIPLITSGVANGSIIVFSTDSANCSFEAGNELDISATDNCSDSLLYTYTLTVHGVTGEPVAAHSLQGTIFPKGSTLVSWQVKDAAGNIATWNYTVAVEDKESPLITGVSADPAQLWPPNHQLRDVTVNYSVSDNCGAVTTSLAISSNEPVTGRVDHTSPDWMIVNDHHVKLRAERLPLGSGRVYTIAISATDSSGNTVTQPVTVTVPCYPDNGILTVKVFPNPAPHQFIVMTLSTSVQPLTITVTDNTGKIIETRSSVPATGLFYLGSRYLPGIYYLEVKQANRKETVKLIKTGH